MLILVVLVLSLRSICAVSSKITAMRELSPHYAKMAKRRGMIKVVR
jgi:hypothetical protein